MVWTSLGQDGSQEGVYGQFLHGDGSAWGGEQRVNTTVINGQIHPCVASDGGARFLAVWSSYVGGPNSFDLYAQRYARYMPPLQPMNAPMVYVPFVANHPQIEVFWPFQSGLPVDHYEVYVDGGGAAAASVTTNVWVMTTTWGGTHSFQVLYATTDGRRSPLSPPASGTNWLGISYYGIPVEWMEDYWGYAWPVATAPMVPGGPTPLQMFLSGADPLDPSTWLRTAITRSTQGCFLNWNPQPGLTYQVQSSSDLKGVGQFRPAAVCGGQHRFDLPRRQYPRLLPDSVSALKALRMLRFVKQFGCRWPALALGLQPAFGFTLDGPPIGNGGDAWEVPRSATAGGDIGAPKNLGEEYRWNTPYIYYAFDQSFLDYFGSNGVWAVEQGIAVLNGVGNFPVQREPDGSALGDTGVNYRAQALHLFDLKSVALNLMLEELPDPA